MKRDENGSARNNNVSRRKRWLVVALVLLVLLLVFITVRKGCGRSEPALSGAPSDAPSGPMHLTEEDTVHALPDTVSLIDSSSKVDSVDSVINEKNIVAVLRKPRVVSPDTLQTADTATAPDSAAAAIDTAAAAVVPKPDERCKKDSTELWVYPDPSGGLHYREVKVHFVVNRPATVHYRFKNDSAWLRFDGAPVTIATTTTLFFDAIDSCGNVMERRSEYYEIEPGLEKSPCLPAMDQVKVGTMNFCIDRYEWPNRKGVVPQAYISLYQATDSCYSVKKRLCTAEEWMVACAGPYTWKYPYGQNYERYGCVTHETTVAPSGSKPECRTFFGAFDMSGNLLEWTSTRAVENEAFTYVMGGFWESGPKSGCRDRRYSYYPQNRHNPVGFRCCRDLQETSGTSTGGKR